jgi:peroxiredoxin Q/BCP
MTTSTVPQVGDAAPDFTAPTDSGATLTLSELRGRVVVLFFYPKDDTPG